VGQAKNRGSQEQRIAEAKAKVEALKPEKMTCNKCESDITEIQVMDTRGMDGVDAVLAGICPNCGETTLAFLGDPEKVADAMLAYQDFTGQKGILGVQTAAGERIKDV
jgi:hypothetical protein